jgi:hypothetical protein
VQSWRVAQQNNLTADEYTQAMCMELDSADEDRLTALEHIRLHKMQVMKTYNKKVKPTKFEEGDLVWRTKLPIGLKDRTYLHSL